jgi:hypothetical protein
VSPLYKPISSLRFLIYHPVDYATDLTVAVVERCMESSSSDTRPKIPKEERVALKHLIQNVGRIYPPRRFAALLVATLVYIERIEGRTNMKEGVNMTCSVFVGGVILASRVGSTCSSRSSLAVYAHPRSPDHARSKVLVSGLGPMHQHPIPKDLGEGRAGDAQYPKQKFFAP